MKFLKEWKLQSALYAVLYVILGAILLLFPETTATTLCYALGIAAVVVGVSGVFVYLFRDAARNAYRNDFVFGLVAILLGVFIFCKVELIISLIPFILGIAVIVSGFIKLQDCIDVRRMGYGNGLILFLLALVNLVLGIVLVLNPFHTAILLFRIMGAGLIFSGISDLVTSAYMSRKIKDYVKDMEALGNSVDDIVDDIDRRM